MNTHNVLTRDVNGYADGLSLNSVLGNILTSGGTRYFLDGNSGVDTNDGLSWGSAFKTWAAAVAASDTNIALSSSHWASRNSIFVRTDCDEVIVKLPNKCDVYGVGSYNAERKSTITGNILLASASGGTRIYNMAFKAPAGGGNIFTSPSLSYGGISLIDCEIDARSTAIAGIGIMATPCYRLQLIRTNFIGQFATAAISLGAGQSRGLLIDDCFIESGAAGILVNASFTSSDMQAAVINNKFAVTGAIMTDLSDKIMFSGNRGFTKTDGKLASCLDYNANLASDNYFSCSGGTMSPYPVVTAAIPS